MTANLPFPIAFPYHLIGAGRSPAVRYERLLQCFESAVRYCAMVQISDYLAAGCPDTDLNRQLLGHLGGSLALGDWIQVTRKITALQKGGAFRPFMQEMVRFYFKQK
jgi:hypothetical protein